MSRQIDAQIYFAVLFHSSLGPALDVARAKYVAAAVRLALSLGETALSPVKCAQFRLTAGVSLGVERYPRVFLLSVVAGSGLELKL